MTQERVHSLPVTFVLHAPSNYACVVRKNVFFCIQIAMETVVNSLFSYYAPVYGADVDTSERRRLNIQLFVIWVGYLCLIHRP